MIIILDSNIWIAELGLNSALGAVTRFYVHQKRARIALPEVVRLEVEHNFRNSLREFVAEIAKNHRQLLAIFGALKEVVLPSEEDIDRQVGSIFDDLGVDLFEIPFSISSAKSSFIKTIDKLPPSDKTQEFKDGVLWADCCRLLDEDDVNLVTADKAFYLNRTYTKGLARNLCEEISGKSKVFKIFSALPELIEELKVSFAINEQLLVDTLLARQQKSIDGLLSRARYQLSNSSHVDYTAYATEKPNLLYLKFNVDLVINDATSENRPLGSLVLRGDGNLGTDNSTFESIRVWEEEIFYYERDGIQQLSNKILYATGVLSVGHKEVSHFVREKLDA